MDSILVFDPGESTGWCYRNSEGRITVGTCGKSHLEVAERIAILAPDIVVMERFNLYPGMAKTLSWNSFYPCEVIGVIRYLCIKEGIPVYEQAPSVKNYSGVHKTDAEWQQLRRNNSDVTEHSWDAYTHLKYFERNQTSIARRNKVAELRKARE